MERNFWRLLLSSAISMQGVVLAVGGILIALFYKAEWTVSGSWLIVTLIIAIFFYMVMASILYRVWPLLRHGLPKVVSARETLVKGEPKILLLLEQSELFGFDAYVSIYRRDGVFEEMIGLGRVLTIQQTGLIQIVFVKEAEGADLAFLQSLREGKVSAVSDTIVKPTVPQNYENF